MSDALMSTFPSSPAAPSVGAYGLTITTADATMDLPGLQPVPAALSWPTLQVAAAPAQHRPTHHCVGDTEAVVLLIDDEHITVQRDPAVAVFHLQHSPRGHELVHPYLAGAAGIFSIWFGRMAFHAGAIIVGGRAWGILGHAEAGKTSTLAHLHQREIPVLTDDLLVLDGSTVLTGPRCLDMRPPTWHGLANETDLLDVEPVRDGERYRLGLPPAPLEVPFAGWVVLADSDGIDMRPVPPSRRFEVLATDHMVAGSDQRQLLDHLAAPMWTLERPRSWSALPRALDTLLTTLAHR